MLYVPLIGIECCSGINLYMISVSVKATYAGGESNCYKPGLQSYQVLVLTFQPIAYSCI